MKKKKQTVYEPVPVENHTEAVWVEPEEEVDPLAIAELERQWYEEYLAENDALKALQSKAEYEQEQLEARQAHHSDYPFK